MKTNLYKYPYDVCAEEYTEEERMLWKSNMAAAIHTVINLRSQLECEMRLRGTISGVLKLCDDWIDNYERALSKFSKPEENNK